MWVEQPQRAAWRSCSSPKFPQPSEATCCTLESACFDQAWVMETTVFPLSRQLRASFRTQPAASPAQRWVSASMDLACPQSQAQTLSTHPLVCSLARTSPPGTSPSLCPRHGSLTLLPYSGHCCPLPGWLCCSTEPERGGEAKCKPALDQDWSNRLV